MRGLQSKNWGQKNKMLATPVRDHLSTFACSPDCQRMVAGTLWWSPLAEDGNYYDADDADEDVDDGDIDHHANDYKRETENNDSSFDGWEVNLLLTAVVAG